MHQPTVAVLLRSDDCQLPADGSHMLLTELAAQAPASCKLLISRRQYRTCHINVPDLEQHLSAIQTGNDFYSFYKVFSDPQKLIHLICKLGNRGDRMALTRSPKGYTLWVSEPDAKLLVRNNQSSGKNPPVGDNPAYCKILPLQAEFSPCMVTVPKIGQCLALQLGDRFYRFFKLEKDFEGVLNVAGRLSRQGSETMIVTARGILDKVAQHLDPAVLESLKGGYVVCLQEDNAERVVPKTAP